jgi:hypothetical protein
MPLLLFAILSAGAPAPASTTCGPTKFTLSKPLATEAPAKKPEAQPAPKPKVKPLADCDKPKKA